jgi:hypothetical protein
MSVDWGIADRMQALQTLRITTQWRLLKRGADRAAEMARGAVDHL